MNELVARYRRIDEEFFEELEEILISADVGVMTVMALVDDLKDEVRLRNIKDSEEIQPVITEKLAELLETEGEDTSLHIQKAGPTVILVVGVNGVGKTTSIGKL